MVQVRQALLAELRHKQAHPSRQIHSPALNLHGARRAHEIVARQFAAGGRSNVGIEFGEE